MEVLCCCLLAPVAPCCTTEPAEAVAVGACTTALCATAPCAAAICAERSWEEHVLCPGVPGPARLLTSFISRSAGMHTLDAWVHGLAHMNMDTKVDFASAPACVV